MEAACGMSLAKRSLHRFGSALPFGVFTMSRTTLTISSKNYSSWSLRGWLLTKLAGIDFDEEIVAPDDADARAEILLLSPSILVPCLRYKGVRVWDTLAIGELLNEIAPKAGLLPKDQAMRAHCRSICGEMHSGFVSLRQALPMNIKAEIEHFKIWSKAKGDIERIKSIWRECLEAYGGPFLFGRMGMADAMYALSSAASAPTASNLTATSRPTPTGSGIGPRCRNGAKARWPRRRRSRSWRWSFRARGPHPSPLPQAGEGALSLLPLAGEGGAKRRMRGCASGPALILERDLELGAI